ncbi:MAG: zinc ABC transporter solute-binding protein, partial [Candidatus Latescibacteria bacterium]|nr:zinc ABC transporter solute-binding protein [Candidatus Latescibacterota bacterium]
DMAVEILSKADPLGKDVFLKNGVRYKRELMDLHAWAKAEIQKIPQQQRVLITAHDAFGYFGLAYGIEVRGLQGISTVAEYGVNDVSQLVQYIVDKKVKAIFVESSVPERSINAVREGCKARGWDVKVGGTLYSDAMGATGSGADTYIGMVRSNVNAIVKGLQ